MTNEQHESLSRRLRQSFLRHRKSVVAFGVVGLILAALLAFQTTRSTTVTVDLGASSDYQLVAGIGLSPGAEPPYAPGNEEYVINHLYTDVTAQSVGDLVSVSSSAPTEQAARDQISTFLKDYLALRNDRAVAVFAEARDSAAARVKSLQENIDNISGSLSDTTIDGSSRTQLQVQQAQVALALTEAQNQVAGYSALAAGHGPIVVVREPRVLPVSLATKLLPSAIVLFIFCAIGIAQAVWRDSEAHVAAG